jgi:hypothetical protein
MTVIDDSTFDCSVEAAEEFFMKNLLPLLNDAEKLARAEAPDAWEDQIRRELRALKVIYFSMLFAEAQQPRHDQ